MPSTSIYLSNDLLKKIKILAKKEKRSLSNFIETYLDKIIKNKNQTKK